METIALRKLLVQMSGAPGSGKTTTANLLAKAIDAFIVDHDVLKTFFLDFGSPFGQAGKNAYRLQSMLTEELLKQGKNVIVDSTVNYQNTLDIGLVLAQRYGYTYRYVECRVSVGDIELLDERLRRRTPIRSQRTGVGRPPPDADTVGHDTDYRALFRKWIERPCRPADDDSVITVYSSISSPETCLAQILERIHPSGEAQISNGSAVHLKGFDASALGRNGVVPSNPTFLPEYPVPEIFPSGYGFLGDYSAVDSILENGPPLNPSYPSIRQKYIMKGAAKEEQSFRSALQHRIADLLGLNVEQRAVICVTSGTNALRAALKVAIGPHRSSTRNEVIVPAFTAVSTAEAVLMEGFVPIIVDVDPDTWLLSPEATAKALSASTVAIVTVDWLGTLCDLRPFRQLADERGISLISDSAQSFGANGSGRPPADDYADAFIYSTGFPKVFHTGGSGGIVICSKVDAEWLHEEPTGFLRHDAMPEANAYLGLRALDELQRSLENRRRAAEIYRKHLGGVPGIAFQDITGVLATNHYQMSVVIDEEQFGVDAKALCLALQAENIHCSTDRMRCLGAIPRLLRSCEVAGDLPVSRKLENASLTLPIFESLTLEACRKICNCIQAIHDKSGVPEIDRREVKRPSLLERQAEPADIAEKFRNYWIMSAIIDKKFTASNHNDHSWKVLFEPEHLADRKISIDQLHRQLMRKNVWTRGDTVVDGLVVHATLGDKGLVLSPHVGDEAASLNASGSSATVALVITPEGKAEVHKSCSHDGIDGNGRPWLERQLHFLHSSVAVNESDIFVKPSKYGEVGEAISIVFPFVPSLSLAEMAFAGMDAESLLSVLNNLLGEMANDLWPKTAVPGPEDYIDRAHFSRMRRRVAIARAEVPQLDEVARSAVVTLNGRKLLGFDRVLDALSRHPAIAQITPRLLSEIHGDLNLHNILCLLDPSFNPSSRSVMLIDPRGNPLLDAKNKLEPGDYSYDIAKFKFTLSGFAEIRRGFWSLAGEGNSFELHLTDHPGSVGMHDADRDLVKTLASNEHLRMWIDMVEPSGLHSLEWRVLLGEAAHFVADSACALGRYTRQEVLPLFLLGLVKLNDVLELFDGRTSPAGKGPKQSMGIEFPISGSNCGAAVIQSALLSSPQGSCPWDVLEVLIKSESTQVAHRLITSLVGELLPEGTKVHVSTEPASLVRFPCVLIHPFVGVKGQTAAVLASIRRTQAFLKDNRVSQAAIDGLKIVTVTSTGASTRSQLVSRQNDKLLSPGPWGLSPLHLLVLKSNQLTFPRPGRWIVENDSFFVLSQDLRMQGDSLCLLTSRRRTSGTNASWRVCIDSTDERQGWTFANDFREIDAQEANDVSLRPTGAIFMPNNFGHFAVQQEADYSCRTSPVLVDFVLPNTMSRECWYEMCHSHGYGLNSDLVWANAECVNRLFPRIELAYGGDQMAFYHFGTDVEYIKLTNCAKSDPLLSSLANLSTVAKWLRRSHAQQGNRKVQTNGHKPIMDGH